MHHPAVMDDLAHTRMVSSVIREIPCQQEILTNRNSFFVRKGTKVEVVRYQDMTIQVMNVFFRMSEAMNHAQRVPLGLRIQHIPMCVKVPKGHLPKENLSLT